METTENAPSEQDAPADAGELIDAPSIEEVEHLLESFDAAISEVREAAD